MPVTELMGCNLYKSKQFVLALGVSHASVGLCSKSQMEVSDKVVRDWF